MIALSPAPATLPDGERVYAVGDVHGCLDKLAELHALIAADLAERPVAAPVLIHLGDYIDRGEDSAGVLARLMAAPPAPGLRCINLMGNHEEMMLAALDGAGPDALLHWLSNGGSDTLASWGVPRRTAPALWPNYIPAAQIDFLRNLTLTHAQGGYIFVHAGLRPGTGLAAQTRSDLLWIREPFLSFAGELPGVVVHGHTPGRDVVQRPNRIGVDTGAVMGGKLSCAVLEGDRIGVLRV